MDYAADARNMVSNGKPRMAPFTPQADDHYQPLPAAIHNTYRYEANRLCRVIHHSDRRIVHHCEHPIQAILLEPTAGHNVARRRCPRS